MIFLASLCQVVPKQLPKFNFRIMCTAAVILIAASPGFGDVTGTIYRDYDADAVQDVLEPGMPGLLVSAYDGSGAAVGDSPQTTAADGSYTLSGLPAGPLRFEVLLPTDGSLDFLSPGSGGPSRVLFATDGSTINIGFNNPDHYCQSDPELATTCFVNGDPNDVTGPQDALIRFGDDLNARADQNPSLVDHIGDKTDLGSVWGVAYDGVRDQLYVSAFLKRHVGMGPGGPGAIYSLSDASTSTPGIPTEWFDLTDHSISVGAIPDNATRGVDVLHSEPTTDAAVQPLVGRAGIGDIEFVTGEDTLYVVNLSDRTIYAIDVVSLAAPTALPSLPDPGCFMGEARPGALKHYDGLLYAGVTCTAENGGTRADLSAHIYTFDGLNWSTSLVDVSLDYDKGTIAGTNCNDNWQCRFNPWLDVEGNESQPDPPTTVPVGTGFGWGYPQPLLADIEIDDDLSIVLGIADRFGHQYGTINNDLAGNRTGYGVTGGDILRVCNVGTLIAPVYVVEGSVGCDTNFTDPRSSNGMEYYDDNLTDSNDFHEEVHVGGMALLPGSGRIADAVFDATPFGSTDIVVDAGGIHWLSNASGGIEQGLTLFQGTNSGGFFGKGAGIGDIEYLCAPAPIEIGNRVWCDAPLASDFANGIQDPVGASGVVDLSLSGVTVELSCVPPGGGSLITASTVTASDGSYLFSNANVTGGLPPGAACTISIDTNLPSNGTALGVCTAATAENRGSLGAPGQDLRDSDGTDANDDGVIEVLTTLGGPGANNHSIDFGLRHPSALVLIGDGAIGDRVWLDVDGDGIDDVGEPGIPNVSVEGFYDAGVLGDPSDDLSLGSILTDTNGNYLFEDLPVGTFYVQVDDDLQGAVGTTVPVGLSLSPGSANASASVAIVEGETFLGLDFGYRNADSVAAIIGDLVWADGNGNGVREVNEPGIAGVTVDLIDLGDDGVPGTPDDFVVQTQTTATDGTYLFVGAAQRTFVVRVTDTDNVLDGLALTTGQQSQPNPSVPISVVADDVYLEADFGYFGDSQYTISDTVWIDDNNDQLLNVGSEDGVPNVTVALLATGPDMMFGGLDDVVIATVVSDEFGDFSFDGVSDGNYRDPDHRQLQCPSRLRADDNGRGKAIPSGEGRWS